MLVLGFFQKKILVKSLYPLCRKGFRQSAKKEGLRASTRNPLPNGFLPCFIGFCVSGSQSPKFFLEYFCRKN